VPQFSINLCQCLTCQTIQVRSPPDTSGIYRNYIYESSSSPDLDDHFAEYARFVKRLFPAGDKKVLEIGGNDGLLLRHLSKLGFSRLTCVDPSPQTAAIDLPGALIVNDFFSPRIVDQLADRSFDAIIANNCFSHIPRLLEIVKSCGELLSETGTLMVEVQSTLDLLEGVVFDYIYHEHYFYHTVTSFENLARMAGLELYSLSHVPTKGGSLRLLIGHPNKHRKDGTVDYWKYREHIAGVHTIRPWIAMSAYLAELSENIRKLASGRTKRLVGYGACATGVVLAKYMELDNTLSFIVDDNQKRQGLFSPGKAIPVLHPMELNDSSLCVVLAWRHASKIIPRLRQRGIKYVVPLPVIAHDYD
jgi:SAM-dependent methyltransferase